MLGHRKAAAKPVLQVRDHGGSAQGRMQPRSTPALLSQFVHQAGKRGRPASHRSIDQPKALTSSHAKDNTLVRVTSGTLDTGVFDANSGSSFGSARIALPYGRSATGDAGIYLQTLLPGRLQRARETCRPSNRRQHSTHGSGARTTQAPRPPVHSADRASEALPGSETYRRKLRAFRLGLADGAQISQHSRTWSG